MNRSPDGWYHYRARVGPGASGWVQRLMGELFATADGLPLDFMQSHVNEGEELRIRTRYWGRFVLVIAPDEPKQSERVEHYMLPFLEEDEPK